MTIRIVKEAVYSFAALLAVKRGWGSSSKIFVHGALLNNIVKYMAQSECK